MTTRTRSISASTVAVLLVAWVGCGGEGSGADASSDGGTGAGSGSGGGSGVGPSGGQPGGGSAGLAGASPDGGTAGSGASSGSPASGGSSGSSGGSSGSSGGSSGSSGGSGGSSGGSSGSGALAGSAGSGGGGNAAGAESGSGLIPDDRRVDWQPGLPGGIPDLDTVCADATEAPYGAVGDGVADDRAAIQAALDACPYGQVVELPAGTYRVTDGLAVPSGVVLRGEGPEQTSIVGDGTPSKAIIQAGSWDEADSPEAAVVGGHGRGSTELTLSSTTGLVVGDFVIVDQLNDGDLVRADGQNMQDESPCSWGSRDDGTRLLGQMVEVTALDEATQTISIDPPLAMPLVADLEPELQRVRAEVTRDVGIEDLAVADLAYRGDNNANIRFWGVAYSWIRNVESENVSGRHIQLTKVYRSEVRDSYVHHAHDYMPGANAYGICVENQTTQTLVENNIVYYLNGGLMLDSAGPGNVIAYNYTDHMFGRDYPDASWLMADLIGNHCAHPFMSLFEGNLGSQISLDNIHGSSSHQTSTSSRPSSRCRRASYGA